MYLGRLETGTGYESSIEDSYAACHSSVTEHICMSLVGV
jgi:hypothetical protein